MRFERFDSLTRRLGGARDRRDLIRVLISSVAVLSAFSWRDGQAHAACPRGCEEGQVCLSGACVRTCEFDRHCRSNKHDPCIIDTCVNGVCMQAIAECLPGYECCRGECCPKSCVADDECAVLDPCRWGQCGAEGQCVFTQIDPCVLCASDVECQATNPGTICCDGACQRPCPDGTTLSKGCECHADASATRDGLVVRDDASG
jgi:hypothetical protein